MTLTTAIQFKRCLQCSNIASIDNFYRHKRGLYGRTSNCRECILEWHKERNATKTEQRRKQRYWRYSRYNITELDYDAMVKAQGNKCAICETDTPGGRFNSWQIDHDHSCCPDAKSCGRCVRGLLCSNCNRALGYFRENAGNLKRAHEYMTSRGTQLGEVV